MYKFRSLFTSFQLQYKLLEVVSGFVVLQRTIVMYKMSKTPSDCFHLSNQKSVTEIYSVYNDVKQKKSSKIITLAEWELINFWNFA